MDDIKDINIIQNTIKTINKIETQIEINKKKYQLKLFPRSKPGIYLLLVLQSSAMLYGMCPGLTTFSLNAYSAITFHYTIIASKI